VAEPAEPPSMPEGKISPCQCTVVCSGRRWHNRCGPLPVDGFDVGPVDWPLYPQRTRATIPVGQFALEPFATGGNSLNPVVHPVRQSPPIEALRPDCSRPARWGGWGVLVRGTSIHRGFGQPMFHVWPQALERNKRGPSRAGPSSWTVVSFM